MIQQDDPAAPNLRRAGPGDAAGIAEIWNHYIRDSTATFLPDERSVADVELLIASGDPAFVWEEDGRILGFARYFQFRGGAGYRHTSEHTVLLAPGMGGRGIGRALMGAVIADARAAGRHTLWAAVTAENAAGIAFHSALGFEKVAILPEVGYKFGRWLDCVLMLRRL